MEGGNSCGARLTGIGRAETRRSGRPGRGSSGFNKGGRPLLPRVCLAGSEGPGSPGGPGNGFFPGHVEAFAGLLGLYGGRRLVR